MNTEVPGPRELTRRFEELRQEIRHTNQIEGQRIDRIADQINRVELALTRVETLQKEQKDDIHRIEEAQKTDRQDIISNRRVAVSTAFVAVALLASIIFGILQLVLT